MTPKDLTVVRLFAFDIFRTGRKSNEELMRTGAIELSTFANVRGVQMVEPYAGQVDAVFCNGVTTSGELYAISPAALKFADSIYRFRTVDRVQVLVDYYHRPSGTKLREAAWMYIHTGHLPFDCRRLLSIFDARPPITGIRYGGRA